MTKADVIKHKQWTYLTNYLASQKITYQEYLSSAHWQDVRKRYYASKLNGGGCWACGRKDKPLNLHHKTYKRIGNERLNDLILLCRDCHKETHAIEKNRAAGILYGAARRLKKNLWQNT